MSHVFIYAPGVSVEVRTNPTTLSTFDHFRRRQSVLGRVSMCFQRVLRSKAAVVSAVGMLIQPGYLNSHCLNFPYDGTHINMTEEPIDVNLGTVRKWAQWEVIEQARGVRDFNVAPYFLDVYVSTWAAKGSKIALVLEPGSHAAWAAQGGIAPRQNKPPAQDVYWTDWVTAVTQRYAGHIESIEFSNEPDVDWIGTHADMARMYRLGRAAAHAVDPGIKIVGPSCQSLVAVGNGIAWMQAFFAASDGAGGMGKDHIDIVGVHYYPYPVDDLDTIVDMAANVSACLTASGVSKPIWNTESGRLNTVANPVFSNLPLAERLRNFKAHCMLPATLGCDKTFYYAYDTDHMGWYHDSQRPTFVALWNQMKAFEGQQITSTQKRGDGGWNVVVNGETFVI